MEPEKRLTPESLDYTLAAIAPAFIISMIGSLVFFLIVLFFPGPESGRLMWVLGLYTFAAVLVARIAIEQSRAQSLAYMAVLGGATLLVVLRLYTARGLAEYLGIPLLILLLVLIAYLADRITFDCTLINENVSSHGAGLLQSIGLFRSDPDKKQSNSSSGRKRKHEPGIWVLYFSLLAIPVFGAGQFFLSANVNRGFAQRMVFIYLFSALSLLVLIALLSLRKYLRERGVPMDMSFATRWIVMGVTSVAALVTIFALLPLPSQPLWNWKPPVEIARRDNLKPNRFGFGNDGVDPPKDSNQPVQPQPQQGQQGQQGQPGQPGQQGQSGQSGQSGQQPQQPQQPQPPAENQPAPSNENAKPSSPEAPKKPDDRGAPRDNGAPKAPEGENAPKAPDDEVNPLEPNDGAKAELPPAATNPSTSWQLQLDWSSLFSWLLLLILLLVALVFGWSQRQALLRFLSELFGRKPYATTGDPEPTAISSPEQASSFASYANPFGTAQLKPEQIVRHTFRALIAWGREHRVNRTEEETPDEFVRRVARKYPEQLSNLVHLGNLYGRIAYAKRPVNASELSPLRELWSWWESSLR
ncbi:DUF4129 domain-containing protein [Pirellulaceae bacterium SH501]